MPVHLELLLLTAPPSLSGEAAAEDAVVVALCTDSSRIQRGLAIGKPLPFSVSTASLRAGAALSLDVLRRLSHGFLVLQRPWLVASQLHRVTFADGAFVDCEVSTCGFPSPVGDVRPACEDGVKLPDSAAVQEVREYLASWGLLPFTQAILQVVAHTRPQHPFEYMAGLFARGFDDSAQDPPLAEAPRPASPLRRLCTKKFDASELGVVADSRQPSVELRILGASGIPDGTVLSARLGSRRRRAEVVAGRPVVLSLPASGRPEDLVVKLERLQLVACERLQLPPSKPSAMSSQFHSLPSDGLGGAREMEIRPRGGNSVAPSRQEHDASRSWNTSASAYLHELGVYSFLEGVLAVVTDLRPADPYSVVANIFRHGVPPTSQKVGSPESLYGVDDVFGIEEEVKVLREQALQMDAVDWATSIGFMSEFGREADEEELEDCSDENAEEANDEEAGKEEAALPDGAVAAADGGARCGTPDTPATPKCKRMNSTRSKAGVAAAFAEMERLRTACRHELAAAAAEAAAELEALRASEAATAAAFASELAEARGRWASEEGVVAALRRQLEAERQDRSLEIDGLAKAAQDIAALTSELGDMQAKSEAAAAALVDARAEAASEAQLHRDSAEETAAASKALAEARESEAWLKATMEEQEKTIRELRSETKRLQQLAVDREASLQMASKLRTSSEMTESTRMPDTPSAGPSRRLPGINSPRTEEHNGYWNELTKQQRRDKFFGIRGQVSYLDEMIRLTDAMMPRSRAS